jgi:N-terminal acetyltransferase B complex catalytic subunit
MEWHGHVTALTVAPEYRRLHLGRNMMDLLERISDQVYHGFFVDLYVRYSNHKAIGMYEALGYSVYRRVREYYGSIGPGGVEDEDAFGTFIPGLFFTYTIGSLITSDMRKPLSRDINRRSVRPNGKSIVVSAADVS